MRFRRFRALAAAALLACAAPAARAQEQQPPTAGQQKDEQVIEEFVTTRGVSFDTPSKKTQKPPAQTSSQRRNNSAAAKSGKGGAGKSAAASKSNKSQRPGAGPTAQAGGGVADDTADAQTLKASADASGRALALGYTILLKDDAGRLSVVDSSQVFKTGDNIAVALEPNADGYLYMFNASDGRNPEMLFPNVQLDGGANSLAAHARATFPADASLDFRFTDPPAREHLFVVYTREPLAGVPTGEALARFCGANVEDCAWKPPAALWERIRGGARGRGVTEARNPQQLAQAVAPQTLQRGLKVKREDPKPAVVRVNNTPGADMLVTEIVLVHK